MKRAWNLLRIISVAILLTLCCLALLFSLPNSRHRVARADAATGSITSSPSSGPVGAVIAVNGYGWLTVANGTTVSFGYSPNSDCSAAVVGSYSAGTVLDGAFHGWFRWPEGTAEMTYAVCAFIGNLTVPANTYTVLSTAPPQLSISTPAITSGQQVTITGSNYLPANTQVPLILQSMNGTNSISLGSVVSDSNGSFSKTFTMPTNLIGPDLIVANVGTGQPPTLSSSISLTVNPATSIPSPTPRPDPAVSPTPSPTIEAATATPTSIATPTSTATPKATPTKTMPTPTISHTIGAGTATPTFSGTSKSGASTRNGGDSFPREIPLQSSHGIFSPVTIGVSTLIFLAAILLIGLLVRRKWLYSGLMKNYPPSGLPSWTRHMDKVPPPMAGTAEPMTSRVTNSAFAPPQMNNSFMHYPPPLQEPVIQSRQEISPGPLKASSEPTEPFAMPPLTFDPSLERIMREAQQGLYAAPKQR